MPRVYKRRIGARYYKNYTDEKLEEALSEIRNKKISLRKAAEKYGIHKNTLWLKLKGKHQKLHGQQRVFTDQEENAFVVHTVTMSRFGFPVTTFDLRCVVKSYLERRGRTVTCFKQNMPGIDWVNLFLKRHPQLSQRFAQNISHARAATDEETVNTFFDNLEIELEGVPPSNIWNYDETNLVDDPGLQKIITKRGTKYPERIRNASKACTSLMLCGNAEGTLAPLYINYKSQKLWNTWTENGPPHARYNRTSSGWFDYQIFEDWFLNLLLPILKRQEGPKTVIGDNLSSHLNMRVVQECEANNIRFVALPPNTTHLLQPLDVAYFRPMKIHWRKILNAWKESAHGSRCISVPKDELPRLLKQLMEALEERGADNLRAGFRKSGIFPCNREEVLSRLCNRTTVMDTAITESVGESFIAHLNKTRVEATQKRQIRRKKRLNVPPGKSISASDFLEHNDACDDINATINNNVSFDEPQACCSGLPSNATTRKATKNNNRHSSESSTDEEVQYQESEDSPYDEKFSSDENESPEDEQSSVPVEKVVGNYVVVNFEGEFFPGKIATISKEGAFVSVMERCGKHWKWPKVKDEIFYSNDELVMNIEAPTKRGTRDLFDVPAMSRIFS